LEQLKYVSYDCAFCDSSKPWSYGMCSVCRDPRTKKIVGDYLCADVRLEVKITCIRNFLIHQVRYGLQQHVETVPVWIVCVSRGNVLQPNPWDPGNHPCKKRRVIADTCSDVTVARALHPEVEAMLCRSGRKIAEKRSSSQQTIVNMKLSRADGAYGTNEVQRWSRRWVVDVVKWPRTIPYPKEWSSPPQHVRFCLLTLMWHVLYPEVEATLRSQRS
jgi:hypothetical protein